MIDENGCWRWKGRIGRYGYGLYTGNNAHRVLFKYYHNEVFPELDVDHLCRVRDCVNPKHLEAIPHRENLLRSPFTLAGKASRTTHCPQDHPYNEKNTRLIDGRRYCKKCGN